MLSFHPPLLPSSTPSVLHSFSPSPHVHLVALHRGRRVPVELRPRAHAEVGEVARREPSLPSREHRPERVERTRAHRPEPAVLVDLAEVLHPEDAIRAAEEARNLAANVRDA